MRPLVSIIVPTFNRARTIGRAIDSVLKQTYDNLDLIVVEDGSTDDTRKVLQQYHDKRIRIINHGSNRGVTEAKNTGLNNIAGEWFTFLDSDDEMLPEAIQIMIRIPSEIDPAIDAITCNCIDTSNGGFSGKGLSADQYLDFKTMLKNCSGEFWGLTKTSLLSSDRFNKELPGYESVLWFKINERAKRYYIHKALRIYHTQGTDRLTNILPSLVKKANDYQALSEESHYLETLKKYSPGIFMKDCLTAIIYLMANNKKSYARFYYNHLKTTNKYSLYKSLSFFAYNSNSFMNKKAIKILKSAKILKRFFQQRRTTKKSEPNLI